MEQTARIAVQTERIAVQTARVAVDKWLANVLAKDSS